MRRNLFLALASATMIAVLSVPAKAHAQAFPSKPIMLIVPYSPGGLPDTVARVLSLRLQEAFGQSVVVENKSGASGAVAAAAITQSPAINLTKRSPLAPDVPALGEKLPGFDFAFNVVVLAKTGTPNDVIARLGSDIAKIVRRPDVIEQLQKTGVDPIGSTPEQLATALRKESVRVAAAAKRANLQAE
ncbi:MAG: tripartite tricarboxylate transporter substrate-binding protein [Burkholderiaceae bacterium]|nr:tripartite tricarboxylate transporter substrate-binding protein [Burkholderiaceae bacterium]MDP3753296.1 tripartite tricarboxylate transporter substrate-binding protein [Polaromonas sp.]